MELEQFAGDVVHCLERGDSYESISQHLQQLYPGQRGTSVRSVRRFCTDRAIRRRSVLSEAELDQVIASRVTAVGHTYGRRSMHGLLRAEGIAVCQRRVGESLERTFPFQHSLR